MKTNPAVMNHRRECEEASTSNSRLEAFPESRHSPTARVSWLHRFAASIAVFEFLAFVLGSFHHTHPGSFLRPNFWFDASVTALISALAIWLFRGSSARYLKILGFTVGALAVAQTLLAGSAPGPDPSPEAILARGPLTLLLFALAVMLALFTRTDWQWNLPKIPDVVHPSFRQLSVFTTLTTFAVMVAGLIHGAGWLRLAPHFIGGIVVTVGALWMLEIALNQFAALRQLKIGAVILAELVIIEILLGLVSYRTELDSRVLDRPLPGLAIMRATHAAIGALTLAASLFATLQSFRYLRRRSEAPGDSAPR